MTQKVTDLLKATGQGWNLAKPDVLTSRLTRDCGCLRTASPRPDPGATRPLCKRLRNKGMGERGDQPRTQLSQKRPHLHLIGGSRPPRFSKSLKGAQESKPQPSGSGLGCHPLHHVAFLTRTPFKVALPLLY